MTALLERELQTSSLQFDPQADFNLDAEQRNRLALLDSFTAPWLEEKLLADGTFFSAEEYQAAFVEFKRYVALVLLSGTELGMNSKPVDEIWHQLILFTREYTEFCDQVLGHYLHHVPETSFTPVDDEDNDAFFDWYQACFGSLSEIWDCDVKCKSCKSVKRSLNRL